MITDGDLSFSLVLDDGMKYSKYIIYMDADIPSSKLIGEYLKKQVGNTPSDYEIGKAFGIFVADAINEESWIEKQDGYNASCEYIDETLFNKEE